MKEGYVIRDQSLPHFLTVTIVDWIDVFSRKSFVAARSGDHRRASRSYIKLRRAGLDLTL